jgi:hydrogenase maturation protease
MEVMQESLYLIIGVGNTLRRDDGAGISLAEAVAGALAERGKAVELRLLQQLLPEMAEEICEIKAQTVLIADCSAGGNMKQGGRVERLLPISDGRRGRLRAEGGDGGMGSHGLGAAALIEMARRLYGFGGDAWLATVQGVDFEHGEGLSPVARQAIDHLTPAIVDLIS